MSKKAKPETIVSPVDDFDGDGVVFRADVVKYPIGPAPYVRLTLDSGHHVTAIELNPEDLGNFAWLVEKARKAAVKSLVAPK